MKPNTFHSSLEFPKNCSSSMVEYFAYPVSSTLAFQWIIGRRLAGGVAGRACGRHLPGEKRVGAGAARAMLWFAFPGIIPSR
jgi:hypothetical protein